MRGLKFGSFAFTFVVLACAVLAALAPRANNSLKIGALLCLTGTCAEWGNNALEGLTLAAEELNRAGGVNGVPIEIIIEDSREDIPSQGIAAFQSLLVRKGIRYIIGPTWSAVGNSLGPIAAGKSDILMISPSVGLRDFNEAGENLFNIWPHDDVATKALAHHAFANGLRRGAIASSQQPWEKTQGDTFAAEFTQLGGVIVRKEEPLPEATDLRAEALRIVQSKPEFIVFSDFQQMGVFARTLKEFKFQGEQFAVLMDRTRIDQAQGGLAQTVFAMYPESDSAFRKKFEARFGNVPGNSADTAYDALQLLMRAIKDHGDSVSNVTRALLAIRNYQGASGTITFDSHGGVIRTPVLYRVESGAYKRLR